MSRHLSPESLVVALIVVLVLVGLPAACIAEAVTSIPSWELSCGVRLTDSTGLGYTSSGLGAWCWRDHRGDKWSVRTEVLFTTASKTGTSYAGVVLFEERRRISDSPWWWGVGTEWTWQDGTSEWSDRLTLSLGFADESPTGHGQSIMGRLLGPDSTKYQSHGLLIRYESLYPDWRIAIEGSEIAFEVREHLTIDSGRYWGRRFTVLLGYRWGGST